MADKVVIFGAGAIGCYIGGLLALAGGEVTFIGRARLAAEGAGGLHLTDYRGGDRRLPRVDFVTGAEAAAGAALCWSASSRTTARRRRPPCARICPPAPW